MQLKYILTSEFTTDPNVFEQPVALVYFDKQNQIRLIEPTIIVDTAKELQDEEKAQLENTIQIGIHNLQFLEAAIPKDAAGNTELPWVEPTPFMTPTPSPTPSPMAIPVISPTPTPGNIDG